MKAVFYMALAIVTEKRLLIGHSRLFRWSAETAAMCATPAVTGSTA
jgi:hypothetical protein